LVQADTGAGQSPPTHPQRDDGEMQSTLQTYVGEIVYEELQR
jgi:hypothetical protein